ncbi:MAG TPA: hypothetical protein VKK61_07875 [Tepidisphaeraceae bacterium]|nr:hypothetical protein [Tepidisphaeraceae bacterium]
MAGKAAEGAVIYGRLFSYCDLHRFYDPVLRDETIGEAIAIVQIDGAAAWRGHRNRRIAVSQVRDANQNASSATRNIESSDEFCKCSIAAAGFECGHWQ